LVEDYIEGLSVYNESCLSQLHFIVDTKRRRDTPRAQCRHPFAASEAVCKRLQTFSLTSSFPDYTALAFLSRHPWLRRVSVSVQHKDGSRPFVRMMENELVEFYDAFERLPHLESFTFVFPMSSQGPGSRLFFNMGPYYRRVRKFFATSASHLRDLTVTDIGLEEINAILDNCPKLRSLCFKPHGLDNASFDRNHLPKGKRTSNLESLTVSCNLSAVNEQIAENICRTFTELRCLNLSDTFVMDQALEIILGRCKHLEVLHLNKPDTRLPREAWNRCEIQPGTFEALFNPDSARSRGMRELSCRIPEADDTFVERLCRFHGASLTHLHLRDCHLTDAGLHHIARHCTALEHLRLSLLTARVGVEAVVAVIRARPRLQLVDVVCLPQMAGFTHERPAKHRGDDQSLPAVQPPQLCVGANPQDVNDGRVVTSMDVVSSGRSRLRTLRLGRVRCLTSRDMMTLVTLCPDLRDVSLHGCVLLTDNAVKILLR
jgi:hypothetical protein